MTAYKLSADDSWPDQGLNRILAKVESFNTDDFNDTECLEMLIYLSSKRLDARSLAEEAIKMYGSLAKVYQRPGCELRELIGLDHSTTSLLAIAKTSMKRILAPALQDRHEISSFAALMDYVALDLREADGEILRTIYLDAKSMIIRDEEMCRGTFNNVSLYPNEVAKRAMACCASSVVLAHNHLSDDPTPSNVDIKKTKKTKDALQTIDVDLHDHVIVARNNCFSMQQEGLI